MSDETKSQSKANQSRDWFTRLMTETLKRYARNASIDYLVKKYPGLPKDIIAERYIVQQARMAALAGAASATVVSAAFTSSVVAIPTSAITIPVGIAAFAVETGYTIRLQIRTAYDLCNLYGLSVNPDNPEDVQEIFAMGMGIKAGELTGSALQRLAPAVAEQQARRLMRKGLVRRRFQDWVEKKLSSTIANRYLSEKFLLGAVPWISVLLAAGWNYYFTKGLGRTVQARVRGRGMGMEYIRDIQIPVQAKPELLLASALNIMGADSRVSENELSAYKELAAGLRKLHPDFVPEQLGSQWGDADNWLAKVASVEDEEIRKAVYAISETMTILDGRVGRKEVKRLKQIAQLVGTQVDEARLKIRARPFYVAPAGRGCSIVAWVIGAILLVGVCAGSISLWFLVAQFLQR
ncbi:MAG: EcsC family protein [Anaerolineales bacterium]